VAAFEGEQGTRNVFHRHRERRLRELWDAKIKKSGYREAALRVPGCASC
jgi:hypothetical protein